MKRNINLLCIAAVLGAVPALAAGWGVSVLTWGRITAPFDWAGETLRSLSLSGFAGNLAAWAVTLLISALPLFLLRKRQARGWEDTLLALAVPVLFAGIFYMVNPSWLNVPLTGMIPLSCLPTALSLILGWFIMKWLRGLETAPDESLSATFRLLFRVCAVLLVAGAVFTQLSDLLTRWNEVKAGNTAAPDSIGLTLVMLVLLAAMRLVPDFLAGATLLWGGELAQDVSGGNFDETGVELSQTTADSSRRVAQASMAVAAAANLLQFALMGQLHDMTFKLEIPLLSLALSAGLFLVCRLLQRGRELQEDSESII